MYIVLHTWSDIGSSVSTCTLVQIYACVYVNVVLQYNIQYYIHIHTCCTSVHVYVCIYIHMYVYAYIHMYMYIYVYCIILSGVETASHTGHCPINLVNVW